MSRIVSGLAVRKSSVKTAKSASLPGSIEPGKLADFAVLTDDFLTVKPETIRDMKALSTWVGGHEVYRAEGYQ